MRAPGTTRYQELDVLSMSPGARLLLLYRHLEGHLRLAQRALEGGDVETRTTRLGKASDIVAELLGSLDRDQGGDLADRLASFYAWILGEIPAILSPQDGNRLTRIADMVSDLQSAWATAVHEAEQGKAPADSLASRTWG